LALLESVALQWCYNYITNMSSCCTTVAEQIDTTCALIATLADIDVSTAPSTIVGELTLQTSRAIEQLAALHSELLSRADANSEGAAVGFASTASWLSIRTGTTPGTCQRQVHEARTLRTLPETQMAWRHGHITQSHVAHLCRTATRVDEFADHEAQFVGYATTMTARELRHALNRFEALMRPDDVDRDFARQRNARSLSISTTSDGMVKLDGWFDPIAGDTIKNALAALTTDHTLIPIRQRRADALTELCAAWAAGDVHGGTERPQLLITCTIDQLAGEPGGELSPSGHLVATSTMRATACDAAIIRVVTNAAGDPIDVGRATRTIPPALRRALIVRDQGCVFQGCDRPHGWCDAHHLHHWIDGGHTNLDNTALLCSRHHHLIHQHHWQLERQSDNTWTVIDEHGGDLTHHHQRWQPTQSDPANDPPPIRLAS
jgi:Domain of unknown function (DUF222)